MEPYFTTYSGTIPFILLSLHGGNQDFEFSFETRSSKHADLHTQLLAKQIHQSMNELPSLLLVHIHPGHVNANQPLDLLLDERKQAIWIAIHQWIENERKRYENPILVDIHGYAEQDNSMKIYRGTRYGEQFHSPNPEWDLLWDTIIGTKFNMFPSLFINKREFSKYAGGYTTRTYPQTIQLEFPLSIRQTEVLRKEFSLCFATFYEMYQTKISNQNSIIRFISMYIKKLIGFFKTKK